MEDREIRTTEYAASPFCRIPDNAYDIKPHPEWEDFYVYKIDTEHSVFEL